MGHKGLDYDVQFMQLHITPFFFFILSFDANSPSIFYFVICFFFSQLDEDMIQDVLDLRMSLQETLENADPEEFDFEKKYTPKAFLWATGLIEALSLALHIDGKVVAGVVAPRGTSV